MKKIVVFLLVSLSLVSCSKDDAHFDFYILCGGKYNDGYETSSKACIFYFFPNGNYKEVMPGSVYEMSSFGKATAINENGDTINDIGYAYYSGGEDGYGTAAYIDNSVSKDLLITEGTYYVACFPFSRFGLSGSYEAKLITKKNDKALVLEPIFSNNLVGGYNEWDE